MIDGTVRHADKTLAPREVRRYGRPVSEDEGWNLEDFSRALLSGEIEILLNTNASQVLVVWPWWADPEDINAATYVAESMGFDEILETGNLEGYRIPEVDCGDWDYMVMEVAQ